MISLFKQLSFQFKVDSFIERWSLPSQKSTSIAIRYVLKQDPENTIQAWFHLSSKFSLSCGRHWRLGQRTSWQIKLKPVCCKLCFDSTKALNRLWHRLNARKNRSGGFSGRGHGNHRLRSLSLRNCPRALATSKVNSTLKTNKKQNNNNNNNNNNNKEPPNDIFVFCFVFFIGSVWCSSCQKNNKNYECLAIIMSKNQ